jgi:putative endopeptidase
MRAKSLVTFVLSLLLAVAAIGQSGSRSGFDRSNLDETCAPCQDFYKYVNGGWMKKNSIPPAFSAWSVFRNLSERNQEALHEILVTAAANKRAPAGSNEQKIGDLYTSCMDEQAIESLGAKPLDPFLAEIKKVKDGRSLQATVAQFHAKGIGVMFSFSVSGDAKNSTMNIAYAGQGGLSLPDRNFYLKQDDKSKETRVEYTKHIARMFELLGDAPAQAETQAQTVLTLETKLAAASMDRVEARNPLKTYFKKTLAELKQVNTNFSWDQYFSDIGHPEIKDVVVRQPDFFAALDREITATPVADWQIYLRWKLLTAAATALPARFDNENFRFFSSYLQGTKEQLPRWRRCVSAVDGRLGEALGQEYVKKHYPAEAKARMKELIGNLTGALREELGEVEWMGEATRKQAIEKLNAFTPRIGHTDKWRDYSKLNIDRASYIANLLRSNEFTIQDNWNRAGKPVDRGEWLMTPPTVNAYYQPVNNEIVFPAGILQPPFFDFTADDAFN